MADLQSAKFFSASVAQPLGCCWYRPATVFTGMTIRPRFFVLLSHGNPVNKNSKSPRRWPTKEPLIYFVLLLVVLGMVARPLAKGSLFYQSYWGGAVFVPFVLLVAALIFVIVLTGWNRK
jgi:polyferredoxin